MGEGNIILRFVWNKYQNETLHGERIRKREWNDIRYDIILFTTSLRGIGIFVLGRNKTLFVTLCRSVPKQIKYKQHTERVQRSSLEFTAYRLGSSRSLTNHNYDPIMFLLNVRFLRSKSIVADLLFLFKIINSFIHCPRLAESLKYALMRSSTFTRTFLPHRIAIYPR